MQLSKLRPGSRDYALWTITALVVQGDENPALAHKMFYPMAEKLFQKVYIVVLSAKY